MSTPSQVQVEQRARSLCLRNFNKACNRYETFLSKVDVSVEENQMYFDDIVSTCTLLQEKQETYLLTLNEELYENEISWIDDPENKFHELRSKKIPTRYFSERKQKEKGKSRNGKENSRNC